MPAVVTAFLRHRGDVLLVRRSDAVGTYPGRWGGVSGYIEPEADGPLADARRELREEVGVRDAALVRRGSPHDVVDGDRTWTVHPFLFEADAADRPDVEPNEEIAAWEWVQPSAIFDRETVPALWDAYARVAPSLATVERDESRGSAWLSIRALEVLRDAAAAAAADADDVACEDLVPLARALRDARPSMVVIRNRVNRVMAEVGGVDASAAAIRDRAVTAVASAYRADEAAASAAADVVRALAQATDAPASVASLSRSGTVEGALRTAADAIDAVLLSESRPGREGVAAAESLAAAGLAVTLTSDAALPTLVERASSSDDAGADGDVVCALVGADVVLSDGAVANKVGTYALALACDRENVPVYVAAASDKVAPVGEAFDGESRPATDVYDGSAAITVENPVFDRTPAPLIAGILTERGSLDRDDVAALARTNRENEAWDPALAGGEDGASEFDSPTDG